MRRYETTYILRPNLGEEQFSEIIERTNAIVTDDGGTIINLERQGNRKLAYEIKKETLGQYIYFDFAAPGSTILEMERIFRIDDNVLRFLTVKLADAIDEETVANETERVAALAAEKLNSEAESADDTAPEKSEASEDKKTSDSNKTDEAKPDADKAEDAPEADTVKADTPEADTAKTADAADEAATAKK